MTTMGIALATYNGAEFLAEQLESLLQQTRMPDQIVISDDGSTDQTLTIIRDFQLASPVPVKILPQGARLGPMGNFIQAARACDTDFIAFCDQDDIWLPNKLKRCEQALRNSGANLAIHSLRHFQVGPGRKKKWLGRTTVRGQTVDGLAFPPHEIIRGMCMVISKDVLPLGQRLRDLWEPRFEQIACSRPTTMLDHWSHCHDLFALMAARVLGPITFIHDILAYQRQHAKNYTLSASWSQPKEIMSQWSRVEGAGHLLIAESCSDITIIFGDINLAATVPRERYRMLRHHYERWATIFRLRAQIRNSKASLTERVRSFYELLHIGAYRGRFSGGLGYKSLVRDFTLLMGPFDRSSSPHADRII